MEESDNPNEQCCANCEYAQYDEEADLLRCTNELQIYTYVDGSDYCVYHELPY